MTESSEEEEVDELFSEQSTARSLTRIYLQSQPKTESFDKFVLDEVMIARAMMKGNTPLCSLSEKQRQRAAKLREGIAAKTADQLSNAVKPCSNTNSVGATGKEHFSLEGWLRPQVRSKKISSLMAGKATDGQRASACRESTAEAPRDMGVATKSLNKETQVDFDLEGWSVPPITTVIMPFNHFGSDASLKRVAKNLHRAIDSDGRRHGKVSSLPPPSSEVLGNNFSLGVNATDKAHAISSKPIEECFQSVVANRKQGDYSRLNDSNQKPGSVLEDEGKKHEGEEKSRHDKMLLQSGQVWNSGDISLTSIEKMAAGKSSGSGANIVDMSAGVKIPASATDKLNSDKSVYSRPQLHTLARKKTEGPIVLPPLQNSLAKLRKKYPTVTRTLTSEFSDGLAKTEGVSMQQHLITTAGDFPQKHWSTPAEEGQRNDTSYFNFATRDLNFHHPRAIRENQNRLSWTTILEDARKVDGYKQIHAENKKEQELEPEAKKPQEVGYLQKHLRSLSYGKMDNSRQQSGDTVDNMEVKPPHPSTQKMSRPIDILLEKEVQRQYPFVHYDSKSKSLSSL